MKSTFILFLLAMIYSISISGVTYAQDANQVMTPFFDLMSQAMQQAQQQQQLKAMQNTPEFQGQQIQPGGLSHDQVIVLQQMLITKGYDVGAPDGVVGAKTRAVVAQLQAKAGVPINGLPTPELLEALVSSQ